MFGKLSKRLCYQPCLLDVFVFRDVQTPTQRQAFVKDAYNRRQAQMPQHRFSFTSFFSTLALQVFGGLSTSNCN